MEIVPEIVNGPCVTLIELQLARAVPVAVGTSVAVGDKVAVGESVVVGCIVVVGDNVGGGVLLGVAVPFNTRRLTVGLVLVRCPLSPLYVAVMFLVPVLLKPPTIVQIPVPFTSVTVQLLLPPPSTSTVPVGVVEPPVTVTVNDTF